MLFFFFNLAVQAYRVVSWNAIYSVEPTSSCTESLLLNFEIGFQEFRSTMHDLYTSTSKCAGLEFSLTSSTNIVSNTEVCIQFTNFTKIIIYTLFLPFSCKICLLKMIRAFVEQKICGS